MTPFTSVLAATDFSVLGNNAVRRAALLAHEHVARLRLVHVLDPAGCKPLRDWFSPSIDIDLKAAQARDSLRRFAVEIAGRYDVAASVEVMVGDPIESLMQASEGGDLLVFGRRGHTRLQGLLVGRTADRVLRTSRRPVLVVKSPVEGPYRRVLAPVDLTDAEDAAVQVAARLAHRGTMHLFHAINAHGDAMLRGSGVHEQVVCASRQRHEAGTLARLRRKAVRMGLDTTRMGFAVAHGHPVWSILGRARELEADLIVAGKQGRSTLGEFLLGSVSRRVLAEATCDLLIVPRPRPDPFACHLRRAAETALQSHAPTVDHPTLGDQHAGPRHRPR